MLIIVSQHSAAFLCNFDSLMFFITKTSQRADRKQDNTTFSLVQVCALNAEKEIYATPAAYKKQMKMNEMLLSISISLLLTIILRLLLFVN